jgi:nucleotide-binding universal stress UspA family protein
MVIRTILLALSGGKASEGAAATACRLARRFDAHLEALHVRPDPRETLPDLGVDISVPVATELIELVTRDSAEYATKAKSIFDAAVARHVIPIRDRPSGQERVAPGGASASWREMLGHPSAIVPLRARCFDLVVLGRSGRVTSERSTDTVEETVFRGGPAALLAPMRPQVPLGEVICIAWNNSPEAARAVGAAMPLLSGARQVHILMSADAGDHRAAGTELSDYLAWHGIAAASHLIRPRRGVETGELVRAAARDRGADMLVMGGYGRAPWREMIFGGTTRRMVGISRIPLLLAH